MSSSPRPRSTPRPQRSLKRQGQRSSAGLVLLCGLLYLLVGFIVTAVPGFPWIWPVVLVGTGLQVLELTVFSTGVPTGKIGARILAGVLRWFGAIALTVALASALNYLGTDQLNDITLGSVFGQVLGLSLLAFLLAMLCRLTTARLEYRLQQRLRPRQTLLILSIVTFLSLAAGGTVGLLTVSSLA
jgi:hypothetical protein